MNESSDNRTDTDNQSKLMADWRKKSFVDLLDVTVKLNERQKENYEAEALHLKQIGEDIANNSIDRFEAVHAVDELLGVINAMHSLLQNLWEPLRWRILQGNEDSLE